MIHQWGFAASSRYGKQMFLEDNIRRFCRCVNGESESKLALAIFWEVGIHLRVQDWKGPFML